MITVPWLREEVKGASLSDCAPRSLSDLHDSPSLGAPLGKSSGLESRSAVHHQVTHRRSRRRAMPSSKTPT